MTDPRFDPAFQRGYSGPEPELVVRAPAPVHTPSQPVRMAAPPSSPSQESARPGVAEADASAAVRFDSAEREEPWRLPRRNPFGIALLAVGVAMLVLGAAMIWSTATQNNIYAQGTFDTAAQALSLVNYLLPPALLLGGILGILGWLVLHALGAFPRRDSAS